MIIMKKLPIGISTLSEIIENDYIYVDKTQFIHEMISTGKTYFLSRPRRFGKSLLISTLEEIFKGNKKLFKGLYIHDKWPLKNKHPVIHLDFGSRTSTTPEELKLSLNKFLNNTATENNIELEDLNLINDKFEELIKKLYEKTGKKVVVLIDEYDKPIIDNISSIQVAKQNRALLNGFYQVLKSSDKYLRFIFLTGVTKFSKTSIFSGLNNLTDITLNPNFSNICGYTQKELEDCFEDYIDKLSNEKDINREKLLYSIKEWYNGYSWDGKSRLYNPYSILNLFTAGIFNNYWFETGTPTLLMKFIKTHAVNVEVLLDQDIVIHGGFPNFTFENIDFITLLLQTGYLTIKNMDIPPTDLPSYELTIPNREVSQSLFKCIVNELSNQSSVEIEVLAKNILNAINNVDNELLQKSFDILTSTIPSVQFGKVKEDIREANYHIWFLSWFSLMGFSVTGEESTSHGSLDMVLKRDNLVVICEFKYSLKTPLDDLALEAINQIKKYEYYKPYLNKNVVLIGIAFGDRKCKSMIEKLK